MEDAALAPVAGEAAGGGKEDAIASLECARVGRLLVRGVNWVGDAVMTTPALRAIRRGFPAARITMLVKPWVAPVYAENPHLDALMAYDAGGRHRGWTGKMRLVRDLKSRGFDAAVLLQNAFEAGFLAAAAGIPVRIGYDTDGRRLLLTHPVRRPPKRGRAHQTGYYLGLLKDTGAPAVDRRLELVLSDEDRRGAEALLRRLGVDRDAPVMGVNPSAAFGPAKQWPAERWTLLARRIHRRWDVPVLVFGAPADRALGEAVATAAGKGVASTAGRTRLGEAMALVERCRVFVTNDSGLMHVAAALETPLVAIFGSTDPGATGPWSRRSRVVAADIDCRPCLRARCPLGHAHCMEGIAVDRVFRAVEEMVPP
jgi:heptosyltransferase-2